MASAIPAIIPSCGIGASIERLDLRAGKRLLLHCGAVDYRAQVWVNGRLVATHEGGHTPFSADITAALDDGQVTVVIRAEDPPHDLAQPRGKQDWQPQPHTIWYHAPPASGSRSGWSVDATHIVDLRWTPELDQGLLGMSVTLPRGAPGPCRCACS